MGAGGSVEECFPEADEQTRQKLKEAYEAKYKDSPEEDMRAGMKKEYEQLTMPSKTGSASLRKNDSMSKRRMAKKKNNMFFQKGLRMSQLRRFPSKTDIKAEGQSAKTEEQRAMILKAIQGTLFEATDTNALDQVINQMTEHQYGKGDTVCYKGSTDFKFSVVESGKIMWGEEEIPNGHHYGEMSLIFEDELPFDVTAAEDSVVWELGRDTFRQIQHLSNAHSLSERAKWLQQVKLLENLTPAQLARVASAMKYKDYAAGQDIVTQGDEGEDFYVVHSGSVDIYVKDARRASVSAQKTGDSSPREEEVEAKLVDTIGPGHYFGEKALITMDKRNATCRAKNQVRCLTMGKDDFRQVMGPMEELLEMNGLLNALNQLEILKPISSLRESIVKTGLDSKQFTAGEVIVTKGEQAPGLYILQEGDVYYVDEAGEEHSIAQGMSFGEESWSGTAETFTVKARGDAKCMLLTLDALNSAIGPHSWKVVAEDGKAALKQNEAQGGGSLPLMCSGPLSNLRLADLETLAVLGEGSFGQVAMVKATHPETNETIGLALKRMCKQHIVESGQAEHIQRERDVLAKIPANNFLLHLYATFQDRDCVYMLTNLCLGGELFSLIHTFDGDIPLEMKQSKFYATNVFLALEHLHKYGVIYRDMKPENILLDAQGYLCVIDLGFGKFVPWEEELDGVTTVQDMTYTMCGTPEYMAPEFVLQTGHNGGVDYWALGVLIYEMLFAKTPFLPEDEDMAQLFKNIAAVRTRGGEKAAGPNVLYFPSDYRDADQSSDEYAAMDLICSLLAGNPMYRLGMLHNGSDDFRQHGWFKDIDWSKMEAKEYTPDYKPALDGDFDARHFDDEDIGQLPILEYQGDAGLKVDPFTDF